MAEVRIDIHFDATTVSNNYNDGQQALHERVSYAWKNFTGGYVNSDSCDPPWYEGKGRGFDGASGQPIARHFTTVAFMDRGSAAHHLLEHLGLTAFTELWLLEEKDLVRQIEEKGVTNFRIERPAPRTPEAPYISETGQFWGWMSDEKTHWRDYSGPFGNMIVPVEILAPPMPSYVAVYSLRPKEGSALDQEWVAERGDEVTL